ncbi:cell division protein CrgA [Actinopolymorpha alba]|uniref:cell division protein CrgA n=1 Tax=Actinopolymorpha alba TaxID=533267 RepID=UPI00037C67F8|nr:cell division protein CrgA [Actinopolymorpha alba]
MPESRNRKKQAYTPPSEKATPAKKLSGGRWVAPVMLVCFLVGLAWIVTFYLAGSEIPGMRDLQNWNILIGMGLIAIGFVVSTQWR